MIKKLYRNLALTTAGLFCLLHTQPTLAAPSKSEIEQLKQQVQQLMEQNKQLNQRLTEMEKSMDAQPATPDKAVIAQEVTKQLEEKQSGANISEFITLNGSIYGDYEVKRNYGTSANTSEFDLDTVELILGIKATDWATGKIVIDYDGGDEDRLYVDEAHVTLGNTEKFPLYLTAGKIYAPFGDFSTSMIQDTFNETIGEINEKGIILGVEHSGFTGTLFSFNGMDENDPDNDTINGYGASLAYSYEDDAKSFTAGISWVNSLASAGGIADALDANGFNTVSEDVSGLSLHLGGKYGAWTALTEYTTALDSFAAAELPFGADGAEPSAWSSEIAYTTAILNKETVFAVGYQKSWESVTILPEQRYLTSATVAIFADTKIILEYYFDEDYSLSDGGTDDDGYGFTTRLDYEF